MDFDNAVTVHVNWKFRLRAYIRQPDGSLNAEIVSKDDQCELGEWLYGDGLDHKAAPCFEELRLAHAAFHRSAGAIVAEADRGNPGTGQMIDGNSEFARYSSKVTALIGTLRRQIADR